jgi:hypothetical protein
VTSDPRALHEPLEVDPVRQTVQRLHDRIAARFPERGLRKAAGDLLTMVDNVEDGPRSTQNRIRGVRLASRILIGAILVATLVAVVLAFRDALTGGNRITSSLDVLPLIETTVNDIVFAALAVFFLFSFPERLQRGRTLELLHQLRSLAHIIDMHQLTKDPEQLRDSFVPTPASQPLEMTRDEMERYLEYCSEMLSLVGKTAALCAEESRDSVVLDTVSTIETLTTGMSRKIWQKISVLPK